VEESGSGKKDFQGGRSSYQRQPAGWKQAAAHQAGTWQAAPAAAQRQPVAQVVVQRPAHRG
jgi:hypothetical protein